MVIFVDWIEKDRLYSQHNMTQKNLLYTAPHAELLVVRFEENFLDSAGLGIDPITDDGNPLGISDMPVFIPDIF